MDERGRRAGPADGVEVCRLWEHAISGLAGQRGGAMLARSLTRPALAEWVGAALGDQDRLMVLGSIDSVTVGLASVVQDRGGSVPVAVVELIFVEPEARQVGVAEAMLAIVKEQCQAWKVAGIDAPALPGSRAAKSFFEVHGFQARLLTMHLPIAGGRP